MLALQLAGCTSALRFGLPDGAPILQPADATPWQKAGWRDVVVHELTTPANAQTNGRATRITSLTYVVPRQSGWMLPQVLRFVEAVPQHFAACEIVFERIRIVVADPGLQDEQAVTFRPSDVQAFSALLAEVPGTGDLNVLFVDTIGYRDANADIGAIAFDAETPPYAVIARLGDDGKPLHPEQIVTHEIGHLLGLGHAPVSRPDGTPNIDLMHPRGCLHCAFTEAQCKQMRAYPGLH